MLSSRFTIPLIAIVALLIAFIAWQLANPGVQPVSTIAKPTNVVGVPVQGEPGSMDVTWRWVDIRSGPGNDDPGDFAVRVDDRVVGSASAGGSRTEYSLRATGLQCNSTVQILVTAGDGTESADSDLASANTGPCATTPTQSPSATPTPRSTPSAQPTETPAPTLTPTPEPVITLEPDGDLLPPTDLVIEPVDGEPNAFIVFWSYPEEGDTVPTEFEIRVDNVPYERTDYEGTDFNYSWYVGEQPCGGALDVVVVAVNEDETASSDPAEWEGC